LDVVTKLAVVLVGLMILTLTGAACSATESSPSAPGSAPADGGDSAGEQACSRFREVASGAFGESLSESQVVSGLEDVGAIAADSTNPAIKDNAKQVAAEADAGSMISGAANGAQDALAEAFNEAYPV
jgi:hypothetical protein